MKLFVTGFPKDFDDTDLKEMFQLYGDVTEAIEWEACNDCSFCVLSFNCV